MSEARSQRAGGALRSGLMRVRGHRPHHQSRSKVTGSGGWEKEKSSGSSNQSKIQRMDGGTERRTRRGTQTRAGHSFTRRLRSMLTIVPHFSLDQPTSFMILTLKFGNSQASRYGIPIFARLDAAKPLNNCDYC